MTTQMDKLMARIEKRIAQPRPPRCVTVGTEAHTKWLRTLRDKATNTPKPKKTMSVGDSAYVVRIDPE